MSLSVYPQYKENGSRPIIRSLDPGTFDLVVFRGPFPFFRQVHDEHLMADPEHQRMVLNSEIRAYCQEFKSSCWKKTLLKTNSHES